jgi:hypothetical protein
MILLASSTASRWRVRKPSQVSKLVSISAASRVLARWSAASASSSTAKAEWICSRATMHVRQCRSAYRGDQFEHLGALRDERGDAIRKRTRPVEPSTISRSVRGELALADLASDRFGIGKTQVHGARGDPGDARDLCDGGSQIALSIEIEQRIDQGVCVALTSQDAAVAFGLGGGTRTAQRLQTLVERVIVSRHETIPLHEP